MKLKDIVYIGGGQVWTSGNDGTSSGLDADLWDGNQFSSYLNQSVKTDAKPLFGAGTAASYIRIGDSVADDNTGGWNKGVQLNATNHGRFRIRTTNHTYGTLETYYWADSSVSPSMGIYGNKDTFRFTGSITTLQNKDGATFWHSGNDGAGSGLDADTVDGIQGASFLRSDADDSFSGNLTTAESGWIKYYHSRQTDANDGKIGAGVFDTGLNIVGVQTAAGTGRQVRIWGDVITSGGDAFYHAGNLRNVSQLTNDAGYITSYTDTNTVTSVGVSGDLSTGDIVIRGGGATTVTKSGGTITITSTDTDTNTTYSAGTNLSLSGTTFNVSSTPSFSSVTATNTTFGRTFNWYGGNLAYTSTSTGTYYRIMRVYYNQGHWGGYGTTRIKIYATQYRGGYQEWVLKNYTGGVLLQLNDYGISPSHSGTVVTLGDAVRVGTYSGLDTYYRDVYMWFGPYFQATYQLEVDGNYGIDADGDTNNYTKFVIWSGGNRTSANGSMPATPSTTYHSVNYAASAGTADSATAVEWDGVRNKPSTFAPSSHTHAISNVTGLQDALNSKQAAGDYAAASHGHAIRDVEGLEDALNGKQAAGSYVIANGTTNANIDSDWGQSFKTFDPIPAGTPPMQSPNIRTINIGNDYNRRTQLAFNYESDRGWFRRRTEAGWGSWREFIHSGNIGDQSVSYATSAGSATTATTATNLGADYTADDWFRATADNNPVKFYGNTHQITWRTDGATEAYSGIGAYPYVWTYGGSSAGNRRMLMDTSGNLWTNTYGWLHDYFQRAGSYAASSHTHAISDVTGLQTALDGKQATGNYAVFSNNIYLNGSTTTADFITELINEHGAFQNNYRTYKVAWDYAGNSNLDTGIGTIELAGCTIECWGETYKHVRITRPNTGAGGATIWEYNDQGTGYSPGWRQIWTSRDFANNSSNWNTAYGWGNHAGLYAAATHGHAIRDVEGLQDALDGKQAAGSYAAASHTHDDRYYTESESDGRFFYAPSSQLSGTNLNDLRGRGVYYSADQYGTNSNIPYANYFTMLNLTNDVGRQAQLWFGDTPGTMYWRPRQGDSTQWHPWEKVITTNNIGSQSVNYATSAGNADTVDSVHASSFVRNDVTNQYLKPYYEYGSYLTTERPIDLRNQMGGGGLRVDFMHPSYTGNGNWGHTLTWSGYDAYTTYQLAGSYGAGAAVELYVRNERNHERTAWSDWRRLLHDGNYSSYALPLSGGTVTGTSEFNASTYPLYVVSYGNTANVSAQGLQVYSRNGNGAIMAFHRGGYYAVNMGLDSDNVIRIGGWSASANRMQLDMSGNVTFAGNVTGYSDARIKTDIQTIDNALEKVKRLRGVSFRRTDSDDRSTNIGVIAQEVLEVLPEVVSQDASGMYNVAYGNMAGVFIEAIKQQQALIEQQQKQIDELKALVNGLTK